MYPANLIIDHKPCAVIGGGAVALQKVQSLLAAKADVTVIAPELHIELQQLAAQGALHWLNRKYAVGDEAPFELIICACDDQEVNRQVAAAAQERHIFVNVCDQPALCTFTAPAVLRQGDLTITISTNGCSPAFARWLRRHLTTEYGPIYGQWLSRLSLLRQEARQAIPTSKGRQRFWQTALTDEVMELVAENRLEEAEEHIRHAISHFRLES
jgi:siroheme synthase-like protein